MSNGLRLEFPGVSGEETLVRFPVAVRLSEAIDGFTYQRYNENNIRFYTEDNQEVPFEIDTWNASGESLVWVQVPELKKGTALYIRSTGKGKKDYTDKATYGENRMWADYAAVWHMGSLVNLKDATGNGYDAALYVTTPTPAGLELRTVSAGPSHEPRLGTAVRWPGNNTGYIGFTVANLYQQKLYNQTSMSVEAAVSLGASADSGSYARIFQCGNGAGNTAIRCQRSNTKNSPATNKGYGFMSTIWTEKAGTSTLSAGTPHPDPNEYREYTAGEKFVSHGALAFHGMSYDGAKLDNFTGSAADMISLSDTANFRGKISRDIGSNLFTIGCRQDNKQNWYDGEIDELRISAVSRSAAWMENCRHSMLSPETYVSFRYIRGAVPVYDIPEGESVDVSGEDWEATETDQIIVDGKGTLNLGGSLPQTITLRGNNTLQIDDTGSVSPNSRLVFDHDEASMTLDVLVSEASLQDGNPIKVLTGTNFRTADSARVTGVIRLLHGDGTVETITNDIEVSIVDGNVYLTKGSNPDFDFDIETGSLTLNTEGSFDLANYDFTVNKLVVKAPVVLLNYALGNDLAGRPTPGIDLTLDESCSLDLRLKADDNYFVGQEALLFSSVTGDREGAIRISWTSTGEEVNEANAAANGLRGTVVKAGGRYLFRASVSANPLINVESYPCSFVIDFPSFTDDKAVLTNYPVGVVFSNDIPGFNYSSVKADSLRFTDEFGNELPYEIENGAFNVLGKTVVWVRVPYFRKGITLTACINTSGEAEAPVYEGDRAMCAHPQSSDVGFDPAFAHLQFNPLLQQMTFPTANADDVVDVTTVDFDKVQQVVVKQGPGTLRFGAKVPKTVVIEEGTVEFSADATPTTLVVNGKGNVLGLQTGNDLADNEAALAELVLGTNEASVDIVVRPSPGLYVGQTQEVIRKITGNAANVTVSLAGGYAVHGDLRREGDRVLFTCTASEVPLVTNGADYWCEADIVFPYMTADVVLTNFPVAVRFNEDIDGFRYRTANFETLRFADAEGNDLPYEVDGFNEKGTTLVWVMVPYFTKSTAIKAYWGMDADKAEKVVAPAAAHVGPRAPFHNYAAVWHMDVRGDNSILDSTQNGFDLRFFGKSTDGFAFGSRHIGNSVTWPMASSGNGWSVTNGLYEQKVAHRPGLSTEVIASSSPKFKSDSVLLCTTRASNYNHGYLKVSPGQHGASRFHVTHTTAVDEHLNATVWDDSVLNAEQTVLQNHEPAFFGGVFNGVEHLVYNYFNLHADSHVRDTIDEMPLIEDDVSNVRVGAREGAVDYDYQGGMIDEVRISNRARSAEWMRQIYHTFFTADYSAITIVRDGSLTNTVASGTADATAVDYDTRVLYKKGAGTLTLGSSPDILFLDEGAVEFTRMAKDDLPFEITVADGTTLAGIVFAPTNTLPSKVTIAEDAKWNLVLNPPDLLWEKDVVTVIPNAVGAVAENINVSLMGPLAHQMQVEPIVDASGAIRVRVTQSPRGLQKWSTYTHMMTIYFNGYRELETLEDFPALVRLSNRIDGFNYGQFVHQPTDPVFDLRFADYQGNEIPYEIDTWDGSEDGESLIWVSVPKLQAGGRILMYWGLAKNEDGTYKELLPTDYTGEHGVWKEYDAVYHFNEIDVKDQTENHNDPEKYQWLDNYFRIEKSAVGHAIYFATNTLEGTASRGEAQRGYILPGYYENWMLGATNHTIECIATMSKSLQGYAKIMSATRTATPGVGYSTANYLYRLTADGDLNGMWGSFVYTKDGPASNGQRWYSSYWTPNGVAPKELDVNVRVPVFMGCVFDGEKREYTDYTAGKYAARPIEVRTILGESTTGYDPVSLGFRYGYNGQSWFDNMIDELRMCRKARSPAWMNAVNLNALKNGEFCQYSVEGAHGNEKPIINAAVVEVNAAGANLLITLPNAGIINGERMGQATIFGKVWELEPTAEAEPEAWETFGIAQEGRYISSARMIYQPERTYRAVVYAETTSIDGQVTLTSNVETNDFTTLSRGIRVNQEKTKGDHMTEAHHARVHVATGGEPASTAVLDHPGYVEMLVVGAGGSGGHASPWGPGSGGGAGGLFYRPAMWVEAGEYAVFAAGPTESGTGASEVTSPIGGSYFGLGRYQVSAGGRGMSYGTSSGLHGVNWSVAGGSGGGGFSSSSFNMTMGTGDQGFWGGFPAGRFVGNIYDWASWAGAGGGGATRDGGTSFAEEHGILGDAGQGGEGRVICITGREEFYGGGGGGGIARSDDNRAGARTYAGGGAGGDGRHLDGHDGADGFGGGGGGGAWYPGQGNLYPDSKRGQGGAGGSGVVVWRYTPIPDDVNASPVVMFSEIRGDNMSANLTIPVVCLGEGAGEKAGTYSVVTEDDGNGHYRLTRTDQVCTLYFRYGVDRFNLDHEVMLTDKAYLGEHTFKVTGLLRNQAYWGRIRAVDGVGHEFQTRELPFETTDEGDDAAVDVGYPRLGDYSYVTTNGHEVIFTGQMLTDGLHDVKLYLATNVNDLVCRSGEGAWNGCYPVTLDTATNHTYTIRANDLVPGTRYWYVIEAADANPAHVRRPTYQGLLQWYENNWAETTPMKDRTHHQYTTFVTPRDANLSRTYREAKDFENAEDEVPVVFSEVLKETGSLPARLELCITQVNETTYAEDHAVMSWPLTTSEDGEGGCGLYSFATNFPYGTMIKYHWRVVNTFDEKENTTDQVKITTYVGNPNLFYWIRPSSAGVGDWWEPANWHNPNENYKDANGKPLPLNKWPLPNVGSTVIFTNMVDGAWVNVTGRCDILRVNLSIGTNRVTFIGANSQYGHAGQAELVTKFFKTSGSGSSLTFDNIKVPLEGQDFDWFRESYIEDGSSGTVTRWRDVDEANLTLTNKAEVSLCNLTFAPLAGELKVCDKASLSVVVASNSVARIGGGVHVTVDNATLTAGSIYLQHADVENAEDLRHHQATTFDFLGAAPQLVVERVIGNRLGAQNTPFTFHVPIGGWAEPVVWHKGIAGLSAFGFAFEHEENVDGNGVPILIPTRGTGGIVAQVDLDSPAFRSVRTVNPTLIRADHGFWNDDDPYIKWWVSESHGLGITPRSSCVDLDRSWRRTNEVYYDQENAVSGNYGATLLKARITGKQRTVLAVEANDGEVVHRRGTVSLGLDDFRLGAELPDADPVAWSLERHSDDTWNDAYVRLVAEAEEDEQETSRELYVGVDEGLLGMTAVKNMDAFSTYVDMNVKVKRAWTALDPIDYCDKAKIAVTFDEQGRLCVISGALADTDQTVTNVTDVTVPDEAVVRLVIQAARNVNKKEYFKVFVDGVAAKTAALEDPMGLWLVPDAQDGKLFPARTIGRNPIGMGKVGLNGAAILFDLAVGARPPAGYEETLTVPVTADDGYTKVQVPYSYIDAVRTDNTTDPEVIGQGEWKNGYKLWASYALGLDPTDETSVFWTNGRLNVDNARNYLMAPMNVEPPEGSLAEIGYKLQYSANQSDWTDAYTLLGDEANFQINKYASMTEGAASYVRLAATVAGAEIPSINTFGALKIDSVRERAVIAVPWVRCDKRTTQNDPIQLSEYLTTGEIDEGDYLLALDEQRERYLAWVYNDRKWKPTLAVSKDDNGQVVIDQGGDPTETELIRGSAVWLLRQKPTEDGKARRFHLVGQVPDGNITTTIERGGAPVIDWKAGSVSEEAA
ncbi:MAG: DUF2341 domain-containing protein, partial [Kiritimatiellae bacterium]|nr:DUF2341 domain-containing protein [Kiritimatiellia bacterium]